jgi:hypothetical protein
MRRTLLPLLVLLAFGGVEAGASRAEGGLRKTCRRTCGPAIAACMVEHHQPLARCRHDVLRRCRHRLLDCAETVVSTTTEPPTTATTSTATSSTTETTTATTSTETTTTTEASTTSVPFCSMTTETPTTSTTPTTQDPTCAGSKGAYVQTYQFAGELVFTDCPPMDFVCGPTNGCCAVIFTQLSAAVRVTDSFPYRNLVGQIYWDASAPGGFGIGSGGDGATGKATYPEWQMQLASTYGRVLATLEGLPRERAGCQDVAGTVEFDSCPYPGDTGLMSCCSSRYAGTWSWLTN